MFENKIYSLNRDNKIFLLNKFKFLKKNISFLERVIKSSSLDKNLKKGYAIIKNDESLIKNIKTLKSHDQFSIVMSDGKILIKK